jgi:hypothetical protein
MSALIQVPDWPGRSTAAQAAMTRSNAVSKRTSNESFFNARRRLRLTRSSSGRRTMRGSGENQRIGASWYQGKIPLP